GAAGLLSCADRAAGPRPGAPMRILLALLLLGIALVFGYSSFRKSMTPYIAFDEAKRSTGLVQVNGTLADKDYVLRKEQQYLRFDLKDAKNEVMPVVYRGVIPGNFDQATSIVAIGRYDQGHFE